jgi:uncharacterized membrane protein YfcA
MLLVFGNLEYWQLFAGAITFGLLIAIAFHFLHRSADTDRTQLANEEYPHPGITMHRIRFGAGFAGLVFTIGCMALFLAGAPILWYPFIAAIVIGLAIACLLHMVRR